MPSLARSFEIMSSTGAAMSVAIDAAMIVAMPMKRARLVLDQSNFAPCVPTAELLYLVSFSTLRLFGWHFSCRDEENKGELKFTTKDGPNN